MPTNDFISNILEIKDLNLLNVESSNTELHIHFKLKRRDHVCPKCGAITNKVHDYRTSIIKDAPILGKHLFLHYSKRRYRCTSCNARFLERFFLLPKHCRLTTRFIFLAIDQLKATQSVSAVAKQTGISTSSIFRRMADVKFPKPSFLPRQMQNQNLENLYFRHKQAT